jgi:glucose-6-phosphate 1-dehydrogenase
VSTHRHKSPPPPCAIVIFGANGDLTKRLIIPALYNLARPAFAASLCADRRRP